MFVWPQIPTSKRDAEQHAKARETMYRRELEDRAALLLRLGRSPAYVKARLLANVGWDFELHARPSHAAEVDKIVDAVVRRQSAR